MAEPVDHDDVKDFAREHSARDDLNFSFFRSFRIGRMHGAGWSPGPNRRDRVNLSEGILMKSAFATALAVLLAVSVASCANTLAV